MDMVACHEYVTLVSNLKDAPIGKRIVAMVIDCEKSPGYVKLQVVANGKLLTDTCPEGKVALEHTFIKLDIDGRLVLSDLTSVTSFPENFIKNGPAVTVNDSKFIMNSMPSDYVVAVRYKSWPEIANEWISRKREYDWPPKCLIERFQKLGCFMVHVGSPESEEINLEWRISFSLQERELVFGLNNVQHKCYVILKWIKHHLFRNENVKTISSYHCKTCLFYMIERNPQNIWVQENFAECIIGCLKVLKQFVFQRNCPNYFVANENMFARITDDGVWNTIEDNIQRIIEREVQIVINIVIYQSSHVLKDPNGQSSVQLKSVYSSQITQMFEALSHNVDILRAILELDKKPNDFDYHSKDYILETINAQKQHLDILQNTKSVSEHTVEEVKNVIDLVVPYLHTIIGSHLAAYSLQCENVQEEEEFKRLARQHFNLGAMSDLTSGRLKLISYMFIEGQYSTCLKELTLLEKMNWDNITSLSCVSLFQTGHTYNTSVLSSLESHDYSGQEFAQTFCSMCIVFCPTEVDLMPSDLQIELFRTFILNDKAELFSDFVFIDSHIYLYFLLYLIYKKTNKTRQERLSVIQQMENALPNTYHVSTALNLIAWALAEEGFILKAMVYLVMSWNQQPNIPDYIYQTRFYRYDNLNHSIFGKSAIWHALILLWRIWFMDFISGIETLYGICMCFKCFKQQTGTMKKCPKCKIARYCSIPCQQQDCNVHQIFCEMLISGV